MFRPSSPEAARRLWVPGAAASLLALGVCVLGLASCQLEPEMKGNAKPPSAGEPNGVAEFGAKLSSRPATSLADVLARPEQFADRPVLVEGHVKRACSRKGCWMEVATSSDTKAPSCRVTFEDYAFFVPTDSAGKNARVEGKVVVTHVKASHVEHLESEGGTFQLKNADGSATEVQLLASGVELTRS